MKGWECPRCGKCYSPFKLECDSCGGVTLNPPITRTNAPEYNCDKCMVCGGFHPRGMACLIWVVKSKDTSAGGE